MLPNITVGKGVIRNLVGFRLVRESDLFRNPIGKYVIISGVEMEKEKNSALF